MGSQGVKEDLQSAGPVAVGTRGQETRKQGRRTTTYTFEVTDFKPGSQMAFRASGGPTRLSTSYLVKSLDGTKSQLDVELKMQMGGIMRLFEPFMAGSVKKEVDTTVGEIKKMIESQV